MNNRVISDEDYVTFRTLLEKVSGIVLGDNKHYLVSSRLNRLMTEYNLEEFSDFLKRLQDRSVKGLCERVIDAMTTNETMWFRDLYPFDALKTVILPEFKNRTGKPLRIWSSACSYGQEPYSINIIIEEFLASNPGTFRSGIEIVATDISAPVLDMAKLGHYEQSSIVRGMSDQRSKLFFKKNGETWEATPRLKNRVQFTLLNLKDSYAALGKFDVIFCRNVLIYFSTELKTDILTRMSQSLNPLGYLILGSSEAPNRYTDVFRMIRVPQGMLYQREK